MKGRCSVKLRSESWWPCANRQLQILRNLWSHAPQRLDPGEELLAFVEKAVEKIQEQSRPKPSFNQNAGGRSKPAFSQEDPEAKPKSSSSHRYADQSPGGIRFATWSKNNLNLRIKSRPIKTMKRLLFTYLPRNQTYCIQLLLLHGRDKLGFMRRIRSFSGQCAAGTVLSHAPKGII